MIIQIYAKLDEPLSLFDKVISSIDNDIKDIYITNESKKSFRKLEQIKKIDDKTIYIISSLHSLGLNNNDIATQLKWFINNSVNLIICDIPATYESGVNIKVNNVVLNTVIQAIFSCNSIPITDFNKRANAGRNKLPYPDNWDELYEKWFNKEISSKKFLELSGLKKTTFFNLLSEYKDILAANEQYINQFKKIL